MKHVLLFVMLLGINFSIMAAYQYNVKGNEGWLSFDGETTLAFDLTRGGKDSDKENWIDRGEGIADYGWYNLNTGESGSFANGGTATFTEGDKIGLYVKDNVGDVYLSTKEKGTAENVIWGKSRIVEGNLAVAGGNFGSNGTKEYYVFKVNNNVAANPPSGQPLPGVIATLVLGAIVVLYIKNRKKLYQAN